ncbi:MAG: hypothetical protein H6627_05055 [Calditrichae bacterium]|nr:hypothetical protein [Calditrichota bacterium]MCB9057912.1 hypothetical protein [Calditrichia bacterium]
MKKVILILLSLNFFFLYSCEDKSVNNNDNSDLQIDAVVIDQAALGFQINQYAGTGNEIIDYTTPNETDNAEIPDYGSALEFRDKANEMFYESEKHLQKLKTLSKTNLDSLIFMFSDTSAFAITHLALYLDSELGIARYEVVSRYLNANRRVQFDSTSIRVAVNNLLDDSDDRFLTLYNLQNFKDGLILSSITTELTATNWANDGSITAFNTNTTSLYSEDRQLEKVVASINIMADESGTLIQTFFFRDGTTTVHSATFNNDGTGSFTHTLRNGISVSGSFNAVEDDGQGFYESTTTFPSGFYLSSIFKSAVLAFDFINKQVNGNYTEVITFNDGKIDSAHVDIQATEDTDGYVTTILDVTRRNGANGQFTISEGDEHSSLSGTWTTWDNYFVIVNAEYYSDGSAWLKYEIYRSEIFYNNGAQPLTVVEYNFMPDGSGLGNLVYENENYDVNIESNGKATILSNGKSTEIELYR